LVCLFTEKIGDQQAVFRANGKMVSVLEKNIHDHFHSREQNRI